MTSEQSFESCAVCWYRGELSSDYWCDDITRDRCPEYQLEADGEQIVLVRTGEKAEVNRDVALPRAKLSLPSEVVIANPEYL